MAPKFPDFVIPGVPPPLAATAAARNQDRGWRFLQAGDLRNAEREFASALTLTPAFYPAEAALGYVELAQKDPKAALPHFERALDREGGYVSALVGGGQALLALNREGEAIAAFEAALAADPSLTDIKRRVEVLTFRGVEQGLERARGAARAGRLDEAAALYARALASSPDSAFLYRELAGVERRTGDADRALEHFRKAVALDPADAKSLAQVGEILDGRNDFEGAAQAYADALAIEPSEEVEAKLDHVRARAELARLPEEYRAIDQAPQITRADLAALIGIRLAPLVQKTRPRDAVLITDVRNNWALTWIMAVAQAGVMEPYANHAFQPRTVVRRSDLAPAIARLLARIAATSPSQAKSWQSARVKFSDLATSHLAYAAASVAVASGVMTAGADNSFQPSKVVSGAEAVETIGRIEALAGLSSAGKGKGGR